MIAKNKSLVNSVFQETKKSRIAAANVIHVWDICTKIVAVNPSSYQQGSDLSSIWSSDLHSSPAINKKMGFKDVAADGELLSAVCILAWLTDLNGLTGIF